MAALVIVFGALVGGAVGSFAGVVTDRGLRASLGGRSHCDGCGRTLAWFELVPFVSYLALRGRCRTCGVRIGLAPFLWEVSAGAIGAGVAAVLVTTGRLGG